MKIFLNIFFLIFNQLIIDYLILSSKKIIVYASWDDWWTYEGISGPTFWGRLNPKWNLCSKGRKQSPIDIKPENLLYDPLLLPLSITGRETTGHLINTGKGLIFRVFSDQAASFQAINFNNADKNLQNMHNNLMTKHNLIDNSAIQYNKIFENSNPKENNKFNSLSNAISLDSIDQLSTSTPIELSGGPLAYTYTLSHLSLHTGRDEMRGSEHTIAGLQFPGELQFIAYNSQLYSSYEEAQNKAHGLAAISIMIQIADNSGKLPNIELKKIVHAIQNITFKGAIQKINKLSIENLLPTQHLLTFCTYEGSITQPACHETVQWLVLNKPLYLTSSLFGQLRNTLHYDENSRSADNFRPIQKINNRTIRTNIEFKSLSSTDTNQTLSNTINSMSVTNVNLTKSNRVLSCTMRKQIYYRANLKSFGSDYL